MRTILLFLILFTSCAIAGYECRCKEPTNNECSTDANCSPGVNCLCKLTADPTPIEKPKPQVLAADSSDASMQGEKPILHLQTTNSFSPGAYVGILAALIALVVLFLLYGVYYEYFSLRWTRR